MQLIKSGFYALILTFLFSGCFGFPRRGGGGGRDFPEGDGDSMLLYASEVMLWCSIAALIFGGVAIAILKRPMLGFQSFGLGIILLIFGYILQFIDEHIELFIAFFAFSVAGTAYLIYKAIKSAQGIGWFERMTNRDWNNDGIKGTNPYRREDPLPDGLPGTADTSLDPLESVESDKAEKA